MVIHDTECPYRNQVSLNNTNQSVNWLSILQMKKKKKKQSKSPPSQKQIVTELQLQFLIPIL